MAKITTVNLAATKRFNALLLGKLSKLKIEIGKLSVTNNPVEKSAFQQNVADLLEEIEVLANAIGEDLNALK